MVAVGIAIPVTIPPLVTVAFAVLLLLHTPPAVASLSVIVWPEATEDRPVIAATAGVVFIVATLVVIQPVFDRNVIIVVPAETPVSKPDEDPIVATETALLDHRLPAFASVTTLVPPTQSPATPAIAAGKAFTVTFTVLKHPLGKT